MHVYIITLIIWLLNTFYLVKVNDSQQTIHTVQSKYINMYLDIKFWPFYLALTLILRT